MTRSKEGQIALPRHLVDRVIHLEIGLQALDPAVWPCCNSVIAAQMTESKPSLQQVGCHTQFAILARLGKRLLWLLFGAVRSTSGEMITGQLAPALTWILETVSTT